jgi:hypothetical protein
MPEISIPAHTFNRLLLKARSHGYTSVIEYLADLANEPDGDEFVLTPSISAALEEGLEDLRNGRVATVDAVREEIKRLGQDWRENGR